MSTDLEENGIPLDVITRMVFSPEDMKEVLDLVEPKGHKPSGIKQADLIHKALDPDLGDTRPDVDLTEPSLSLIRPPHKDTGWVTKDIFKITEQVFPQVHEAATFEPESLFSDIISDFPLNTPSEQANLTLNNFANAIMESTIPSAEESNSSVYTLTDDWSAAEIGAVTIVIFMVPFILCSNLLVIASVIRYRRLHTPTNYFITSLAAVDILVALAVPFVVAIEVFHFGGADGPHDVVLCLLPNRVLMMACGVSVLTLAAIAYDRHTALVSPLEYVNIMTSRKVTVLVALTWVYSAVIVWLPLMIGWYDVPTELAPCSANLLKSGAPFFFLSAIFVPSCIAILVCYFRIFMVARHHAKAIAAVEFAVHRRLQVKFMIKDTKYAKTLALVIGVFLALWFPYLVYIFIQTVCPIRFDIWVTTYLILLAALNSGINPWIYAFKNNEFRAAFKRMFKEFCKERFCAPVDRRASLVSTISTTPRLSRTDSRMISTLLESTLDIFGEKLKRSMESLDESISDGQLYDQVTDQSRDPEIGSFTPAVSIKKLNRQTASCCQLDSLDPASQKKGHKYSRSFSLDFGLSHQGLLDIASQDCPVGGKGVCVVTDDNDNIVSCVGLKRTFQKTQSLLRPRVQRTASKLTASLSCPPYAPLPSISSPPYSPLPSQSPPSYSPLPSSSPPSYSPLPSTSPTHVPSPSPSPPSSSPTTVSQLESPPHHPVPQHSSCHDSLYSSCHDSLYHTLPLQHSHQLPQHSHQLPPQSQPQLQRKAPKQKHSDVYEAAFCYVNEALEADDVDVTRDVTDAFHPSHPINLLTHTQSCPTFDPLTPFHPRTASYWDRHLISSCLGESPKAKFPASGHNYVSRVKVDDKYSNKRFFL